MERKIRTYGGYFESFMDTLTDKEQRKIQYGLDLLKTEDRISAKFASFIKDGLYKLRTEYNGNIYRVFFIFKLSKAIFNFNTFIFSGPIGFFSS